MVYYCRIILETEMDIKILENILKVGETTCIEFKRAGDGAKDS